MSDPILIALITVAAGGIGYLARPVGDWITDRRLTKREADAKRREFQLTTLLALQDEMTAVVNGSIFDARHAGSTPQRARSEEAELRSGALVARLRDAELKQRVAEFRTAAQAFWGVGDYSAKMAELRRTYDATNERVAKVLEEL
jgi:hypothetical protein